MLTQLRYQPVPALAHIFTYNLAPEGQINTQKSPTFGLPATKASQISIRSWRKCLSLCVQPQSWTSVSSSNNREVGWGAAEFKCCSLLACVPSPATLNYSFTERWITMRLLLYSKQNIFKRGCLPQCVLPPFLPPFLPPSFHLFPLLPLLYSASVVLPPL